SCGSRQILRARCRQPGQSRLDEGKGLLLAPYHHRKALRPRLSVGRRAQQANSRRRLRIAGVPHRPFPRERNGPEHHGAALWQRLLRADLESRSYRSHPDHRLRDGDLDVIDMIAIPDRLEEAVAKAQRHDVLDRFFPEEMVDAEHLRFGDDVENLLVERDGRLIIVAEGLFDDDTAPIRVLSLRQAGFGQVDDNGPEEFGGYRKIEEDIAANAA